MPRKSSETIYEFCGPGAGVAGLPHVISESEAKDRGLWKLLQAAIYMGNYQVQQANEPEDPEPQED